MAWLPTRFPPHCKIVVSCVNEPENPDISRDYQTLRRMIDDEDNFILVSALGEELASQVIKYQTAPYRVLETEFLIDVCL